MLRKILELDLGTMTDSEFCEVLDLATTDIKTNHEVTDRGPWFVEVKERGGLSYMHSFAVGVITAIIDDRYRTPVEIVREIRETLSDLEKVWNDGSISDGYRHEKALRANGEPKRKLINYSVP